MTKRKTVRRIKQKGKVKGHFISAQALKDYNEEHDSVIAELLPEDIIKEKTPLQQFDSKIESATSGRDTLYGHPADSLARIAKLKAALPHFTDPRIRHIMEMICVKIDRISVTPDHVDSWADLAGYARTGVRLIGN